MRQLLLFVRVYIIQHKHLRENVEMLTINSICMRMWVRVRVWLCEYRSLSHIICTFHCLVSQMKINATCSATPCTNCWQIDNLCKTLLYLSWKKSEKSERLNYLGFSIVPCCLGTSEKIVNGKSNSHNSFQLNFKQNSKKKSESFSMWRNRYNQIR